MIRAAGSVVTAQLCPPAGGRQTPCVLVGLVCANKALSTKRICQPVLHHASVPDGKSREPLGYRWLYLEFDKN